MLASFSEFKFYQSFRINVEEADEMRFLVQIEDDLGNLSYIDDAKLKDISITGLGFATKKRISVDTELTISLQFKKSHIDLSGKVVRAFTDALDEEDIIYGIEIESHKKLYKFLEQFIMSFSSDRLKDCLIESSLKERYTKASDGLDTFSLLLSLFKDITHYGDKEDFVENMLEEVVRVMNANRASIFLINPETNELEAYAALGIKKGELKFDYRLGVAGSVFTTGVALNIDTVNDSSRFNEYFDKKFNFETKSIICYPIQNREDKTVGVIEVINKRNQDRFTVEDEKTMKVLTLVFSSVFHSYNPLSEKTQIRRFSTPFDRPFALIGKTAHVTQLRGTIIKIKDLDTPVLIHGEKGVGKGLFAQIIHNEGQRGLKTFVEIDCKEKNLQNLEEQLFGPDEEKCKLTQCNGGTLVFRDVHALPMKYQRQLMEILKSRGLPNGKISFNARVLATSAVDLGNSVDLGEFDKDLYEYLSQAFIQIGPLRRRADDIDLLVDYFLKKECKRQGFLLKGFSTNALSKLKAYDWPGNIQELKVCIERAVMYNPKTHMISDIDLADSPAPLVDISAKQRQFGDLPFVSDFTINLKDRLTLIEREMIFAEIKRNNGNKSKAAKEMGISREALRKKLIAGDEILQRLERPKTDHKNAA